MLLLMSSWPSTHEDVDSHEPHGKGEGGLTGSILAQLGIKGALQGKDQHITMWKWTLRVSWGLVQEAEEEELYCICRQPYSADTPMVGCDGPCRDWFHLRCMGLTQSAARALKQWECPLCRCTSVSPASLQDLLARTCRTR